jgi:hypothetical protein
MMELDDEPPRRESPKAVTTVELRSLDEAAIVRGYRAGFDNAPDYSERDRGYWHGYLNGLVDGGHAKGTSAQAELATAYVRSGALRQDVERWSGTPSP